MAKEKIEDVSTEKLLKRKKFFTWILGVYLGVILVFIVLIIHAITQDKFDSTVLVSVIVIAAMIWLPLFVLNSIKKELERRGDN